MTATTALSGVGPARARYLERLGVGSVRDLLLLQPRRLEQRGECMAIADARTAIGQEVSVRGRLTGVRFHRSGGRRSLVRVRLEDGVSKIDALFFNQPWQRERMTALSDAGGEVEFFGRVVETKSGPAFTAPRVGTADSPLPAPGELVCVYPSTEGLGQAILRSTIAAAVVGHSDALVEPLDAASLARLGVPELAEAVCELHRPTGEGAFLAARRRVALEPLLELQARLAARRGENTPTGARVIKVTQPNAARLFDTFPFKPTAAQRRCLDEILADLAHPSPMRRLLHGDVGAGKTAVGVAAAIAVARGGGQAALLAPTELLAEQHHAGLAAALARAGIEAELLTGSLSAAARRTALQRIADGSAGVAIGTHALLSEDVAFHRLDLAIIDEQQRFGVAQRRVLLEKGAEVHALLMTATPIPRTLALTLYGDLDVSLLDERPPGRQPVATHVVGAAERELVVRRLGERLSNGERAFWVVPRIESQEEGDEDDPAAAEEAYATLRATFREHGVELVHGRLAREDRVTRVDRFRSGASHLLVGTTVIEVGVDVPEATFLVVDGAERFGLAQLHQLRGRVGRNASKSHCVLIAQGSGAERCQILTHTDDGFAIAEEDLNRRGMGELGGLRQSGDGLGLGLGDPLADAELQLFARDAMADKEVRAFYSGIAGE